MKRIQGALRNRASCIFICRHPKLIKYYTDWHDVDEDLRTILMHGGYWVHDVFTGIAHRDMEDSPTTNYYDIVASRLIYLS